MPTIENDDDIVTVKEAVKALFKECGGHKRVQLRFENLALSRVYGFTDAASDQHVSFARVAALTSPQATAAARYLSQLAGGVFLPVSTTNVVTTMAAVSDAVREHGEAISGTLTAVADGKITANEAPAVIKEIDEAFAALATLRSLVVQAVKEQTP